VQGACSAHVTPNGWSASGRRAGWIARHSRGTDDRRRLLNSVGREKEGWRLERRDVEASRQPIRGSSLHCLHWTDNHQIDYSAHGLRRACCLF